MGIDSGLPIVVGEGRLLKGGDYFKYLRQREAINLGTAIRDNTAMKLGHRHGKALYYINTNEILGDLSRENIIVISSHVKR